MKPLMLHQHALVLTLTWLYNFTINTCFKQRAHCIITEFPSFSPHTNHRAIMTTIHKLIQQTVRSGSKSVMYTTSRKLDPYNFHWNRRGGRTCHKWRTFNFIFSGELNGRHHRGENNFAVRRRLVDVVFFLLPKGK